MDNDIFSNDKKKATYDAYEKFERFKHSNKLSLADYIIEFEELLYYLEKHEIKLPAVALSQQWKPYRIPKYHC